MIDLQIKVENVAVRDAVVLFFDNYKESIATFLNNVLKNETGSADAFVRKNTNGQLEIYQSAPDKGKVLGQIDGSVILTDYSNLPLDAKYVLFDGQGLVLFLKQPEGQSDIKIGRFANITDVVNEIDSESVETTIQTIKSAIRNAEVEREKVAKQAKKAARDAERRTKNMRVVNE